MYKYLFTLIFFLAVTYNISAFHIVGGEMELEHVDGFIYKINLIQYFDAAQSSNNNPDPLVTVFIFDNATNSFIQSFVLPLITAAPVPYTSPECAIGQLQTNRPIYSATVVLDPELYSDPAGYYMVWERCCRNASVANVVNSNGTSVGMTYVLEFPAIMKDGEPFVNSTPQLFPPLSDYACVNQLFYTNFAGVDVDGDSLVYSLTTPLNSSTVQPVPTPSPKPHSSVVFASGYDENNMIPGSPPLQISNTGFLTVNPSNIGLFVFSVLVEEFRDGVKLGQVTRDFQMLVVDGCDPPAPPNAEVRLPGEVNFYNEVDTIRFVVGEEACFEFLVIDDAGERVKLRAEGVNFSQDVEDIFSLTQGFITSANDTLIVKVCVPECPYVRDIPYIIDLIASDNACPLPQLDTVRLIIDVQPPPNDLPLFDIPNHNKTLVVPENDDYAEYFKVTDSDGDNLSIRLDALDFKPIDYGMSLKILTSTSGEVEFEFLWDTNCQSYDFGERNHFDLFLIAEDLDLCSNFGGDTIFYNLNVLLPPNTSPAITSTLSSFNIQTLLGNTISFDVNANDDDGDNITLNMSTIGFLPADYGIEFENKSGIGSVDSHFEWDIDCSGLGLTESTSFIFTFSSEDEDECRDINSDSLQIRIDVIVPFNNKPVFEALSDYELNINESFVLDVIVKDSDNDFVNVDILDGTELPPSQSFEFNRSSGEGSATSRLEWTPECSLLGPNYAPEIYTVFFLTWDDSCPIIKYDTLAINFLIKELEVEYDNFLPPNAFTPNNDSFNDTYTLDGLLDSNSNLPPDNCEDQFQSIYIFNRTGRQVYSSTDRKFVWTGNNLPSGVYYFNIEYLNTDYKGIITLLK